MMMILSNLTFSLQCDVKCQTEGRVHTGCDCYKKICRSTIVPQCRPPKPSVDERCVYPPVKTFRDGVFSYDESTDSCIQCFRWEIMRKPQVNIDECPEALRKLPNQCISNYNVPGDQGFCKHIFICICYWHLERKTFSDASTHLYERVCPYFRYPAYIFFWMMILSILFPRNLQFLCKKVSSKPHRAKG